MKLRIENNAIRYRITPGELAHLNERTRLEASTQIHSEDGATLEGEFIYALTVDRESGPTRCRIEPSFIMLILHPDDLAALNASGEKGIRYQRESSLPNGESHRFMAYVEVDKPMKHRKRPEKWLEEK
jgi:hypothetical protein